ncbi:hypothetical protein BT69DRAFT_1329112 [Atractiella rhizophila]|nr:hypothetical protein BT69DRAFT_1329112 [Atractiella rhizophila]
MKYLALTLALLSSIVLADEVCTCTSATVISCIVDGIQTFPYSCAVPSNNFEGVCEGPAGSAVCVDSPSKRALEDGCTCVDEKTISCIVGGIQTFPYWCGTPDNNFEGLCHGEPGKAVCVDP